VSTKASTPRAPISRIKAARQEQKRSQSWLSNRTGYPRSHIYRLEQCEHGPRASTLVRIANALNVPVDRLVLR
jgi:transcriptional regulator with XRE-family HTH domain